MTLWEIVAAALAFIGVGLYVWQVLNVVGALRDGRRTREVLDTVVTPRVSVLKPLSGLDDELDENLESFAAQEGVEYEVLFGVASLDDPAVAVARRFIERHPEVDARIIHTDADVGLNPKGAQLVGLEASATGEILVVSDSNTRVRPGYLRNLVTELQRPGVALASNLLVGTGEQSLGSTLENMMLAAFQAPGVVGGWVLSRGGGDLTITVGKSMAMWRSALEEVGGFRSVRNMLAEDQALGRMFREAGHAVVLTFDPVENRNVHGTVAQTMHRHTRWSTTRRSIFPVGYAIEWVVLALPWSLLAFAVDPGVTTALYVAAASVLQMAGTQLYAVSSGRAPFAWWATPLDLVRAWLYMGTWLAGWLNNRVRWRGHRLVLGHGGELVPATAEGRAQVRAAQEATPNHRDVTAMVCPSAAQPQAHSSK